jgi:hypothetical protein
MPEKNTQFWKDFLTAILLSLVVIPPVIMILKRSGRRWLKEGIEGDNRRPDLSEIWEALFMFMALGCFFTMVYMILMKTLAGVHYEVVEYAMVFSGTLGSNTASVFIIWAKQKYSMDKK